MCQCCVSIKDVFKSKATVKHKKLCTVQLCNVIKWGFNAEECSFWTRTRAQNHCLFSGAHITTSSQLYSVQFKINKEKFIQLKSVNNVHFQWITAGPSKYSRSLHMKKSVPLTLEASLRLLMLSSALLKTIQCY